MKFCIKQPYDIDKFFKEFDSYATDKIKDGDTVEVEATSGKSITERQFRALHVWCGMVAAILNENDIYLERKSVISGVIIESLWDKELVKRFIYKPTLEDLTEKLSTKDQDSIEPNLVVEAISRAFAIHKGIVLPDWPSYRG